MMIEFALNGEPVTLDTNPTRRLLDVLREDFALYSPKESCGEGECGSCNVLVDDRVVLSCLMLVGQVAGRSVYTVEGLARAGKIDRLVAAFERGGAVQCGFCTCGFVVAAHDYFAHGGSPDPDAISAALDGNLCRCTGYVQVVEAIAAAGESDPIEGNDNQG